MKTRFLTLTLLFTGLIANAQIDLSDSSAQAVTYWEKGNTHNYTVTTERVKLKGGDTTSKQTTTYDVELTVLNANDSSYTIRWAYKNITIAGAENDQMLNLMRNITKEMKVIYRTNELGMFQEVVNWKEIKEYIHKTVAAMKNDPSFKNIPEMDKALKQIEMTFSTREAIESVSIKDIQQYHMFYGLKYQISENIEAQIQVPNVLEGGFFDADVIVSLDELNAEDENFVVVAIQEVDEKQLTDAVFNYLTKMAKTMKTDPPKKEDLKGQLKNEVITASRIHTSGWIIYSEQTTTISMDNQTTIDTRVIEMQ